MQDVHQVVKYDNKQELALCTTIIRHEASTLRKKYQRWIHDQLILNAPDETEEELQNRIVSEPDRHDFDLVEWRLTLGQILLPVEYCVINGIYISNFPQRVVARQCLLSQPGVSRVHRQALSKLRLAMAT